MIKDCFKSGKTLFIPFIMSGFPDEKTSLKAMHILDEAGAEIIEIGVPFSDPVADGPVNQHAADVAIANGTSLSTVLDQIAIFRTQGGRAKIVLFSYFNPILALGDESFIQQAIEAGVDGLLVVDLPPEEGTQFFSLAEQMGLEMILLVSPTTDNRRFQYYQSLSPAFIYYISRLAVTGMQQTLSLSLHQEIQDLRQYFPESHIAAGFGISTVEQARNVAKTADAFVVGSKLVATLDKEGIEGFRHCVNEFVTI